MVRRPPSSPLFPCTTLFRSAAQHLREPGAQRGAVAIGDGAREPRLLQGQEEADVAGGRVERADEGDQEQRPEAFGQGEGDADRKSTRLNSSHANISYAVFCL